MPLGEAAALCSTVCLPFAHQARDLAVSRGPGCTKAKVHTSLEMSWDLYMFSYRTDFYINQNGEKKHNFLSILCKAPCL